MSRWRPGMEPKVPSELDLQNMRVAREHPQSQRIERRMREFFDPTIFWLGDPNFDAEFRRLTGDTSMTEAAWTDPTPNRSFPGYINAQLGEDDGCMVLTLRGDPTGELGVDSVSGVTQQLRIPLDAWDQFIADAQRVRASG